LLLKLALPAAQREPLDVPFVRQQGAGCGSAAVAMIVQYWARHFPALSGASKDTELIDRLIPVTSRKGIRGEALKAHLEREGFSAFVFTGELRDLEHHIAKGRPLLVCFAPRGPRAPLHYAVVVGVDGQKVWLNDPARGKLTPEGLDDFAKAWSVTRNWALLAVPRDEQ
jgi:predicted double-glycine peptidase